VVSLGEEANRRSLYVQLRRDRQLSVLQAFDMPNMAPNCSQRVCTTVAPQSLMMLNDVFVIEQSLNTAKRIKSEFKALSLSLNDRENLTLQWQVQRLWELAYGSLPKPQELAATTEMLAQEIKRQDTIKQELTLDNSKEQNKKQKKDPFVSMLEGTDASTRALAAVCQVVFASNRFLYAP
jgi:hypothetical protein